MIRSLCRRFWRMMHILFQHILLGNKKPRFPRTADVRHFKGTDLWCECGREF